MSTPPTSVKRSNDHPVSSRYKWTALSNTTIGVLMASVDSSIVIISLPYILQSVLAHTPGGTAPVSSATYAIATASSFSYVIWALLGYMLITATLLLFFGRLADLKGRVKIYNLGFAVFTIGSLLTGLSALIIPNSLITEGIQIIIFRIVQAVGAAMLWSNSAAILTDAFPSNQRGMALGINMVAGVGGGILGLVLGGIITSVASWRYIFFINVPIGVFGTIWAYMKLKEVSTRKRGESLDVAGGLLLSGSIAMLLLGATFYTLGGMVTSSAAGVFYTVFHVYSFYSYVSFALFPILLALFIVNEVYWAKFPLMKFSLFKRRMFTSGVIASSLVAVARGGIMFLLVFYFEGVRGLSAFHAGLELIPMSLGFLLVGPISGIISDRIGYRSLTLAGVIISAISVTFLAILPQSANTLEVTGILAMAGIGGGLFASPNIASIMGSVEPEVRGVGAATNSTLVNITNMMALTVAFVFIGTTVNVSSFITLFIGTTKDLPAAVVNSLAYQQQWITFMQAFHHVFEIFLAAAVIAIIPSIIRPNLVEKRLDTELVIKPKTNFPVAKAKDEK
ncbi:MAG: MFS transporter [Nitrososphaerota archaeon]|nr:MFS transporter [Nitrososphaerota archaeon]MDG7048797.1 MFS transporter [Nitrososphaerota archaeon]MDG7050959.1 MFS transporter [Nitrososphaerota archaeon]